MKTIKGITVTKHGDLFMPFTGRQIDEISLNRKDIRILLNEGKTPEGQEHIRGWLRALLYTRMKSSKDNNMEEEKALTLEEVVDIDRGTISEMKAIQDTLVQLCSINASVRSEFEQILPNDIFPREEMKKQIAVFRRQQRKLFEGLFGAHEGEGT